MAACLFSINANVVCISIFVNDCQCLVVLFIITPAVCDRLEPHKTFIVSKLAMTQWGRNRKRFVSIAVVSARSIEGEVCRVWETFQKEISHLMTLRYMCNDSGTF